MALEQEIQALTVAVTALTEQLKSGNGAATATATTASATKGASASKGASGKAAAASTKSKPKHTREEMQAKLQAVKEDKGAPEAKKIIQSVGGAEKMADIADEKIDAVYAAAEALLTADPDDGDAAEAEDDI